MSEPHITRRSALLGTVAAAGTAALPRPLADARPKRRLRIAIIGSGYGGAVAARRLAAAGLHADLIEMGADWDQMPPVQGAVFTRMTAPTSRSQWFMRRTDMPFSTLGGIDINQNIGCGAGVLGIEYFAGIKVYVGRGFGGGSLVNGGMALTPRRSFFKEVLPQVDDAEMYDTYFPRATRSLGVAAPPPDVLMNSPWYQYLRVAGQHARAAGVDTIFVPNVYDWNHMRREAMARAPRSAFDKEVTFGNNHGKKSLPRTILDEARKSGRITAVPYTEVTALRRQSDGTFTLTLRTITFEGAVTSTGEATYDRVVMAAGSVGTSKLLVAAKNSGAIATLPPETGRRWGPNGNIMLARQLTMTSANETGPRQSTIPAMGLTAWDDSAQSVFAEVAPFPIGLETHTSVYLALSNNPNLGAFTWDAGKGAVTLDWTSAMAQPSVEATKSFFDKVNAANPGSRYRTDLFGGKKVFADHFTYHPLGGMILGEATDLNGEVKGVPGLFVVDGALIPGRLGVNPFVTITALAERSMDRLIAAGRFA